MDSFAISEALSEDGAYKFVDYYNKQMDEQKPWEKDVDEKRQILTIFAEGLRHAALMLLPIMPETAQRISQQLNVPYANAMLEKDFVIADDLKQWGSQTDWTEVGEPAILFAPVE